MPVSPPQVLVKARRALPFFSRHPWVFGGAIADIRGEPRVGAEVRLLTHNGEFIARGLFNPDSQIRVRLYRWEDEPLDAAFWKNRVESAINHRRRLFDLDHPETGCRLIFSEADGLSGLTVDQYGPWLTVQLTSAALAQRGELFCDLLEQTLQPRGIRLRTEKGIAESEGLQQADGLLRGVEPPPDLTITENGLRFLVDATRGQKTGFYLDQRENRSVLANYLGRDTLTRGGRLLDIFCYSGGFGITALALGKASTVVGVDVSENALEQAERNARLNGVSDRLELVASKAFDYMERAIEAKEQFDAIVLDPPKMARFRSGLDGALRGYFSLNRLALDLLKPGGLLVTCSCSGLISREEFTATVNGVSLDSGRPIQILESRGGAPDHPRLTTCPETDYLKCLICRVG
jgi:23S rRNA (cytosine1962-C5)-methyltransferase